MEVGFDEARVHLEAATVQALERIGVAPSSDALSGYVRYLFTSGNNAFVKVSMSGKSALAQWHRLDWDSDIFTEKISQIRIVLSSMESDPIDPLLAGALVSEVLGSVRRDGCRLVITRVELSDPIWVQQFEQAGFQMMDIQVPLARLKPSNTCNEPPNASTAVIREFQENDLDSILAFSGDAFERSHWYSDLRLSRERSDRLYEQWIRNACEGRATFVLVAVLQGQIVGMVAGLWDEGLERFTGCGRGHIDLIAVRRDSRGSGLGRRLLEAAMNRYADKGATAVTVSTQATNLGAVKLYQRAGFDLREFQATLHGWLS